MIKKKKKKNMIVLQRNDYAEMCKFKEKPFRKKYQKVLNYRALIPIQENRKEKLIISKQCAESMYFRYRLMGVPPDKALINPNQTIAEIKKDLRREFKLSMIPRIHLILKSKVLHDNLRFNKIRIHP